MDISSVTSTLYQSVSGSDPMAKMKQLFQSLGSALNSGNLSDAKNALAQLQKNAPANSSDGNNPISAKVEKLSKAIDSGNLKAAKDAYADIKKTMSQGQPTQGRAGGPGGASPGGAKQSSGANGTSSKKEYDKKDLNKDGAVSAEEEIVYDLKNPGEVKKSSTVVIKDSGPLVDTTV
jgi:soluble cytochrome b562